MAFSSELSEFGTPYARLNGVHGTLTCWASRPFLVTHMQGYADISVGQVIDQFYRSHFDDYEFVVTVHDWSRLTDYDRECRKMMQQLVRYMRPKQNELIIHLGEVRSFGQKAVQVAAETIATITHSPIELFNDDEMFERRLRDLKNKYVDSWQASAV